MSTKIISTYHKTGTILLYNIIKKYTNANKPKDIWKPTQTSTVENISHLEYAFFDDFNKMNDDLKKNVCVVVIRNPYEIIVSGARYHENCKEKWTHTPQPAKGNLSLSQILKNSNEEDKIRVEMNDVGFRTVDKIYRDMKKYSNSKNILFLKLEDIWNYDNLSSICKKINQHFGNSMDEDKLLKCFLEVLDNETEHRRHKKNEYSYHKQFTPKLIQEFHKLFQPDLFEVLGYEDDLI